MSLARLLGIAGGAMEIAVEGKRGGANTVLNNST